MKIDIDNLPVMKIENCFSKPPSRNVINQQVFDLFGDQRAWVIWSGNQHEVSLWQVQVKKSDKNIHQRHGKELISIKIKYKNVKIVSKSLKNGRRVGLKRSYVWQFKFQIEYLRLT